MRCLGRHPCRSLLNAWSYGTTRGQSLPIPGCLTGVKIVGVPRAVRMATKLCFGVMAMCRFFEKKPQAILKK